MFVGKYVYSLCVHCAYRLNINGIPIEDTQSDTKIFLGKFPFVAPFSLICVK